MSKLFWLSKIGVLLYLLYIESHCKNLNFDGPEGAKALGLNKSIYLLFEKKRKNFWSLNKLRSQF